MKYLYVEELRLLRAENGGLAILNKGWEHPTRCLETSVLILGKKGVVDLVEGDEHVVIGPGIMCVLSAGIEHRATKPIDGPASYYWFHFSVPGSSKLLDEQNALADFYRRESIEDLLAYGALIPTRDSVRDADSVERLFHEALFMQETKRYSKLALDTQIQRIFIELSAQFADQRITMLESPHPRTSSLVYEALRIIAESLVDGGLCVKKIADTLQHNPDYLGREFKRETGHSIGEYILMERMKLAQSMLQGKETISEISSRCGFANVRHFLRQFKASQGMTPSEARLKAKAMHINTA